jgi:penicillin amidase
MSLRATLFVLAALTLSAADPKSITIYRDNYGVPHVYGPTDASCVFGYIYAQAEDNFWQIEDSYIRALGRASEVYGPATLADDEMVRALEIPRISQANCFKPPPTASIIFSPRTRLLSLA